MREIKFRAWGLIGKKMYESYVVDEDGMFCVNRDFSNNCEVSDQDKVIQMQFTGLIDKNGKEIYEGDIVRIYDFIKRESYLVSSIYYSERYACFSISGADDLSFYLLHKDYFEVIGNIYENPELLEEVE